MRHATWPRYLYLSLRRIGCVINLRDPFVTHAWGCDTESLCRLVNVDNVLLATNPTTATALMEAFKITFAAKRRLPESFYRKLESPSVRAEGWCVGGIPG